MQHKYTDISTGSVWFFSKSSLCRICQSVLCIWDEWMNENGSGYDNHYIWFDKTVMSIKNYHRHIYYHRMPWAFINIKVINIKELTYPRYMSPEKMI